MLRKKIFEIVPKPSNKDVISYDEDLIDLLDIDVIFEYKNDFSIYEVKKNNYEIINAEIEQCRKNIDNIFLFNKKWTKQDYVLELQKEKKNYSKLYSDIKKIENNISILEKKYKAFNEKIIIQTNKDSKEKEEKKQMLDKEIKDLKSEISIKNNTLKEIEKNQKNYIQKITELKDEIELISSMKKELNENEYKCKYCGSTIKSDYLKQRISKLLDKNLLNSEQKLQIIEKEKKQKESEILNLKTKLKQLRQNLKNDISFKKEDYNFYSKKSVAVLKLECERNKILKELEKLRKILIKNPKANSKNFLDMKNRISQYELSIDNMEELGQQKYFLQKKIVEKSNFKNELIPLNKKISKYKKFLEIYFKIYQQKINDFLGSEFKIKLYRFEDLKLIEICDIYYNDIIIQDLGIKDMQKVEKILNEKLSL